MIKAVAIFQVGETNTISGVKNKNYVDVSFSELDPSVISELPVEILHEVQHHFDKKSTGEEVKVARRF